MAQEIKIGMGQAVVTLSPRELLDMMARFANERQKLFGQALEALTFGHKYKNFYVRATVDVRDDGKYLVRTVAVKDFHHTCCEFNIHVPGGQSRTNEQLEFIYDYEIHDKEPRRVRRTSDYKKIHKFVNDIQTYITDGIQRPILIDSHDGNRFDQAIDAVTKLRDASKEIDRVISNISYGGRSQKDMLYDLCQGRASADATAFKEKFTQAMDNFRNAEKEGHEYDRHKVMVSKNYYDQYCVVHWIMDQLEFGVIYENKAALPDDVVGLLAVMEIQSSGNTEKKQIVEGIGAYYCDRLDNTTFNHIYYLVGKEFNDPRAQG